MSFNLFRYWILTKKVQIKSWVYTNFGTILCVKVYKPISAKGEIEFIEIRKFRKISMKTLV
jgi:hypothetical protein